MRATTAIKVGGTVAQNVAVNIWHRVKLAGIAI